MACLGSLIQTYPSEMTDSLNLKNNHRPHCDKITKDCWKVKENLSHSKYSGLICCFLSHLLESQNDSWIVNKQTRVRPLVYWQIASGTNLTVKAINSTSLATLLLRKTSCSFKILQEAKMKKKPSRFSLRHFRRNSLVKRSEPTMAKSRELSEQHWQTSCDPTSSD